MPFLFYSCNEALQVNPVHVLAGSEHCINMVNLLTAHLIPLNILTKCFNTLYLSEPEATSVSLFQLSSSYISPQHPS